MNWQRDAAATRRRGRLRYALRQFRPKPGADLFLRVGVAFGVVDGDVELICAAEFTDGKSGSRDSRPTIGCRHRLLFAFAGEFGVAVGDGSFKVAHIETRFKDVASVRRKIGGGNAK